MSKTEYVGTYIIICDVAGYISGAPIYYRNKAIYLKEQGWRVVILASNGGEVYVDGLEQFVVGFFPFLWEDPASLPKSILERRVEGLSRSFCGCDGVPVIVETGTDWTAYWGELLAQRLGARHMVFFLDEDNQKAKSRIDFFDFKRRRGEMACITKQTMVNLFSDLTGFRSSDAVAFQACCSNSVQDIENDFSRSIVRSEFNIGSVGRLEKLFVPDLIRGISDFSRRFGDTRIQVVFFGGADKATEEKVRHSFDNYPNVSVVVSGFMWPFPKGALEKMDVFASASGSCNLSAGLGIPTVVMDVTGKGAIGFSGDKGISGDLLYRTVSNEDPSNVDYYFDKVMNGEVRRTPATLNTAEQWRRFCNEYQNQLDMTLGCTSVASYYDVSNFGISAKKRVKRTVYRILGEKATLALLKFSLSRKRE